MSSRPPSNFIKPDLSAATLERQLSNVRDRLESKNGRRVAPWLFAAAAALMVFAVVWKSWPEAAHVATNSVVEMETSGSGQALTLADGSRLELGENTRLDLAEVSSSHTRVVLTRGRVTAEVAPVPTRRFTVAVDDYEVRVVGTRFTVQRNVDSGDISVQVARGKVLVLTPAGQSVELTAGQRWSKLDPAVPAAPSALASTPTTGAEPASPPSATAPAVQERQPRAATAKELFERAQRARAAGKNAEAAAAFRELRLRYPNDARAPLAAFELGRIELDAQKDPRAASKSLDDALSATPKDAPYREEIEARRVEAFGAAGDKKRCRSARDAFLTRYPSGIHRARVTRACQ